MRETIKIYKNAPNVAERLHEILADERGAAVHRRHSQFKGATFTLTGRPAAGRRATATAASVASVTARAAAAGRTGTTAVRATTAVLHIEEALFRVEGGSVRIVVDLIVVVESVHLIDVLLLVIGSFVAVSVQHTVTGRTESQTDDTIFIGYG